MKEKGCCQPNHRCSLLLLAMAYLFQTVAAVAICIAGAGSAEWASVPDPVVYSCKGKTAKLPWRLMTTDQTKEEAGDTRWFHHGTASSELVAAFAFGQFLPGKKYTNRVSQLGTSGITLNDVRVSDEGNYSVEVIVEQNDSSLFKYTDTKYLQVSDGIMVKSGRLEVTQDPVALWDAASQQWMIRLLCGHFTFQGQPPIRVQWTLPTGETRASSGYEHGRFYLALLPPVVPEGNYTCRIPGQFYPEVCAEKTAQVPWQDGGNVSSEVTWAAVFVDEIRARLTLAEAEQGRLGQENLRLMEDNQLLLNGLANVTEELKGMKQEDISLKDEIKELWNVTRNSKRCDAETYTNLHFAQVTDNVQVSTSNQSWYRLFLGGKDAVLSTACAQNMRCGQRFLWLDLQGQSIPTFDQDLQARTCVSYYYDCSCYSSTPVVVRNCGFFFLYQSTGFENNLCLQEKSSGSPLY